MQLEPAEKVKDASIVAVQVIGKEIAPTPRERIRLKERDPSRKEKGKAKASPYSATTAVVMGTRQQTARIQKEPARALIKEARALVCMVKAVKEKANAKADIYR